LKKEKGKRDANSPLIESATESILQAYPATIGFSAGCYFKLCIRGKK
jgi:hypothetical protein